MNGKRKILLAIAGILAVGLIGLGAWLGLNTYKQNVYSRNVASGDRYYENGNYSNAVLAYQQALDVNDLDADAYLGLAQTYEAQGLLERVVSTLETGISKTGSARMILMLNSFLSEHEEFAKSDDAVGASVNVALLEMLNGNSYHDYEVTRGIESVTASGDGFLVRVNGIGADFIFRNTGTQSHAVTASGVNPDSLPAEVRLDSLGMLFGTTGAVTREVLESMPFKTMEYSYLDERGSVVILLHDTCRITAACDDSGTIPADAWNEVVPENSLAIRGAQPSDAEEENTQEMSRLYGNTIDATTNRMIAFVSVKIYEGSTLVAETTSDGTGSYEVMVPSGNLTVSLEADGYVSEEKDLFVGSYVESIYQDYYISPELVTGEIRIVLTWSSMPQDLDSYLSGTLDSGAEVFVSYANPQAYGNGGLLAELDVDDTNGYGPETTTIYETDGVFRFWVHDYRETGMISQSSASVTVYLPGQSPQSFTLSSGTVSANDWQLFVIDHGRLIPGGNW